VLRETKQRVEELRQQLNAAAVEMTAINEKEVLFGWFKTEFPQLPAAEKVHLWS